jgi:hypothetical protein
MSRIVITGAPGAGKTTLLLALQARGYTNRPPAVKVDIDPDYQKFDRALKTHLRPVLVPLQCLPFRDFSVEEFLGRTVTSCRGLSGVSAFKGSTLILGQMADASVYVGGDAEVDTKAKPAR